MAAKENDRSKTSKTARVMNLLSKKQDPAPTGDETGEAAVSGGSAPVPPIISSLAPDAAVSVQIKSALEDALEEELTSGTPAAAQSPAPELPISQTPPSAAEPAPAPPAVVSPPVEPVPVQLEEFSESDAEAPAPAAAASVPTAPGAAFPIPGDANQGGYINVMRVLVEEKAEKYAKMFGLCTCSRCMDDVKALALNHLPPKYVVMDEGDRIPKLTFYEGQYNSDITAQLLHACEIVHRRPHHSR